MTLLERIQTIRRWVSRFVEPSRGRQAAVALLLTWITFLVVNIVIERWSFPALTELHAPSFLRQAELVRIASGGRDDLGDTRSSPGDGKQPDAAERRRMTVVKTLGALDALDGFILPGVYCRPEKDGGTSDASGTIGFDDYVKCKILFRAVTDGLKDPYHDIRRFRIETNTTDGNDKAKHVVLKKEGYWEEQNSNNSSVSEDEKWVVVYLDSSNEINLVGQNGKLNFDPNGLNKLCGDITGGMQRIWKEKTTGPVLENTTRTGSQEKCDFTCLVATNSTTPPAINDNTGIGSEEGGPATPEVALDSSSFSVVLVPGALLNEKFPEPGGIVSLLHMISLGKLPVLLSEVQKGDLPEGQTRLLTLWGLLTPDPNPISNKNDSHGGDDPVDVKLRYPISGDPPKASGANPRQKVSVVWFNERDRHQSPFVAVLSLKNTWFGGQELTCRYHLVHTDKIVLPSPEVERVLFWRGPRWLGWRPCGYDSTASQAAKEFVSLYKRTSGGFPEKNSAALPLPQKLEQIERWVEAAIQDQIWFDEFRESDQNLGRLDPLRKPAVDEFTALARRVNGNSWWWGLIQVTIVIAFWYGAISLLFTGPEGLRRRANSVKFSREVMPLLGFLGTVVGISSALLGAGGILSENISDKQRVVSNMTHQLATAFDTTFVALCGSLLLILLDKVSRK